MQRRLVILLAVALRPRKGCRTEAKAAAHGLADFVPKVVDQQPQVLTTSEENRLVHSLRLAKVGVTALSLTEIAVSLKPVSPFVLGRTVANVLQGGKVNKGYPVPCSYCLAHVTPTTARPFAGLRAQAPVAAPNPRRLPRPLQLFGQLIRVH